MLVRRTNEVATRRRGSRGAHADDLARVGPAQGLHNPHCHSTAVLQAARRHQRYRRIEASVWLSCLSSTEEVVRIVVELRDGDPVNELSQTAETATSGAGVERVV